MLPVVCGAQAAFVASPSTHPSDIIAFMVVAQLMPETTNSNTSSTAAAAAGSGSSADARGVDHKQDEGQQNGDDTVQQQGDVDGTLGSSSGVSPLRCVVQLAVRASSHEVLMAIKQQPATWVADISQVS